MSKDTPEVGDVWIYKYKEFKTEYYISAKFWKYIINYIIKE